MLWWFARRRGLRYLRQEAAAAFDGQVTYLLLALLLSAANELARRARDDATLGGTVAAIALLCTIAIALVRAVRATLSGLRGDPYRPRSPFRFLRRLPVDAPVDSQHQP
jgi:hypothetical protein